VLPFPILERLWRTYDAKIILNPDAAFYKLWALDPYSWGPPTKAEEKYDGVSYQTFQFGVMSWSPSTGVQKVG
jgi:LGFP repeat